MLRPFVITLVTLFVLSWLLPALSFLNISTLIVTSIVLTILNGAIKPILKVLLLPINLITFGLFSMVLNAGMIWVATLLVPGFHVDPIVVLGITTNQFVSLLLVSAGISVINSLAKKLL